MNESMTPSFPATIPIAVWIKKPGLAPRLIYVIVGNKSRLTPAGRHTYSFGLRNPGLLKNRYKRLYGNIRELLTDGYPLLTTPAKMAVKPQGVPVLNAGKNQLRIGPLRFIVYSITMFILLPLFLADGRENVKLNKVERDKNISG
ncbi:hypothetical protein BEL04_10835 [Mucilaginibacter sp. PPCGB 2223]|nr:hypothetical protein BEL04_10835 [Mucilaginibacter sp. PPCGB 2223]